MNENASLTELTFNFAAHSRIMRDLFAAQTGAVDPVLTEGPAHSYTAGSSAVYGYGRNLWGPYGAGKVACAPMAAASVGIFDSSDDSWSELPPHGEGSAAFDDVLQVSTEWILLVPSNADYIGWQNLRTGEYVRGAAHGQGNSAYSMGVLCRRHGRLTAVLIPRAAASPLYVDVLTRSVEHSAATAMTGSIYGGNLMAETGRVLTRSYTLNVDTDEATSNAFVVPQGYKPVLLPERKIVVPPYEASRWYSKDFDLNTVKQSDTWSTGNKVRSGAFAPNGDIIGAPYDTDLVPSYRYSTNIVSDGPAISGSAMFAGAVLMPDLRVLMVPRTVQNFYIYQHLDAVVHVPGAAVAICSPYFH